MEGVIVTLRSLVYKVINHTLHAYHSPLLATPSCHLASSRVFDEEQEKEGVEGKESVLTRRVRKKQKSEVVRVIRYVFIEIVPSRRCRASLCTTDSHAVVLTRKCFMSTVSQAGLCLASSISKQGRSRIDHVAAAI